MAGFGDGVSRGFDFRRATLALATLVCVVTGSDAQQPRVPDAAVRPLESAIVGTVYDSITMRPLADAVVQLALVPQPGRVGEVRVAHTDSSGRYQFREVVPGTYLVGFQHLAMDSLGLRGSLHRVDVRTPTTVRLAMAIPSPLSIVAGVCGRDRMKDSVGVLVGSVRDARSDGTLGGSYLSVRWGEVYLSRNGLRRDTPIVDVYADNDGWFTACVPGGTPLLTRASHDTDVSGDVELAVPANTVLRRDLYVGAADAAVMSEDSVRRVGAAGEGERIVTRGTGTVRGVVRGTDGKPRAGARVALLSGATDSRTDDRGSFTLPQVPHGTHTLEARALGYLPGQEVVDIVLFRESRADFYLIDLRAVLIDTVRVAAARQLEAAARAGFERRKRAGTGYFLDEAQIDSMRAFSFKDLLRTLPGVRFVRSTNIEEQWREHIEFTFGGRSEPCLPNIYLDGTLLLPGKTDLDVVINPITIRRIEVYHRGIAIPAEFASSMTCGVLAIWTGVRQKGTPATPPPPPG
jgi:hypothetical protein